MKTYSLFAIAAVSAVLFSACVRETLGPEDISISRSKIIITASTEGGSPESKTSLIDGGTKVYWNPGDSISVYTLNQGSSEGDDFTYNGGYRFYATNTSLSTTADFELSIRHGYNDSYNITEIETSGFWCQYPYCDRNRFNRTTKDFIFPVRSYQEAFEGSFAPGFFPSIGYSSGGAFTMYAVCGGIKFSVQNTGIKYIRFIDKERQLCGLVTARLGNDGKPVVVSVDNGDFAYTHDAITIMAPGGGTFIPGKYYYMVMLPTDKASGDFRIDFIREDGRIASYCGTGAPAIKRATFGVVENIDSKAGEFLAPEEPVDLGLSVKWATCNLGAATPENSGLFYAWGETEPRFGYSYYEIHYKWKWLDPDNMRLLKYCSNPDYGITDYKTILDPEDDAAYTLLGGSWRMPTAKEAQELLDYCDWEQTTLNGVMGCRITSRIDGYTGNSIFLPYEVGFLGNYWTSSLGYGENGGYYTIRPWGELWGWEPQYSCAIRPVSGSPSVVQSFTVSPNNVELKSGDRVQLSVSVIPSKMSDETTFWTTSDATVATVDGTGLVKAIGKGTATITVYLNGVSATCLINVTAVHVPDAVDLGLSVKWASINLLAANPEDEGACFKWGETLPTDDQRWDTYKWGSNDYRSYTKYNASSAHGVVDYKTILDPEDDAATHYLGGDWRMPTRTEIQELINNCNWELVTINGKKGYKVSGKRDGFQDNWIFIPFNGFSSCYWSSVLENYSSLDWSFRSECAFIMVLSSTDATTSYGGRSEEFFIRPVYGKLTPVQSIEVEDMTMYVRKNKQLAATSFPTDASEPTVWFMSNDQSVAYYDSSNGGMLHATGLGTTTVTAYNNGVTATFNVTVLKLSGGGGWSVVGINGNWNTDFMATDQNDCYTVHVIVYNDTQFKWRRNGSWDENYGGELIDFNVPFEAISDGPDINIPAGEYDLILDFNTPVPTITVCRIGDVPQVNGWSVVGFNSDWETDVLATDQGDYYTLHVKIDNDTQFKWRRNGSWDENYGGEFIDFNIPFAAVPDGQNICIPAGEYDLILDLTNPESPTIMVCK